MRVASAFFTFYQPTALCGPTSGPNVPPLASFLRHGGLTVAHSRFGYMAGSLQTPLEGEIPHFEDLQARFQSRAANQIKKIAGALIADSKNVFEPP